MPLIETPEDFASYFENFPGGNAWPGGYPTYLVMQDGGILCHACAVAERGRIAEETFDDAWMVLGYECNWEDPSLYCDHCSKRVESAYAEDEAAAMDKATNAREDR